MVAVGNAQNLLYKYNVGKAQTNDKSQRNGEIAVAAINMIGQFLNSVSTYSTDSKSIQESNAPTETKVTTEDKKATQKDLENEVKAIFEKNELKFPKEITDEVVKKYETMKKFNCGKRSLEQRVIDYANGLNNYGKFEQGVVNGDKTSSYTISGVQEALDAQSMDKYKEAYLNAANEYIELHDSKRGDGVINLTEFLAKEAADANIDIEGLSEEEAIKLLESSYVAFGALDVDSSGNLEKDEVAGLLWRMAVQDDKGTDITSADYQSFNEDLENYAISVLGLDETNARLFNDYMKNNKKAEALKILKENSNLTEQEFSNIVSNVFKGLAVASKNFIEQ